MISRVQLQIPGSAMSYFLLNIADYYELFAIQFTGKPDPTEISWNVTTVLD